MRQKDEKDFLEKLVELIMSILDDLKDINPRCELPDQLVFAPHSILRKVPFCAE